MSAIALMGISRGMEAMKGIGDAYRAQAAAEVASMNIARQIEEIEGRNSLALQEIYKQGDEAVAEQSAAFISGGVELSGSAMSVLSDTLNNAAKASYMRQRETDYQVGSLMIEKGAYDSAASNKNLYMNMASSILGAGAGMAGDYARYNSQYSRHRGANASQSSGSDADASGIE